MTPKEILESIHAVFLDAPRPERFIYGTCQCCECMEHNQTLASHTPETITLNELGNSGWDPICFANHQAFCCYLPAMIRLQ